MFDFLLGYVMGERAASRAASFSRSAGASAASIVTGELADIEARIDRLLLVVDALWEIVKRQGYTDEQLAAEIRRLDEIDGVLDGRRTAQPVRCTACDSMVEPGRPNCSYCGAPLPAASGGPLSSI